MNGPCCQSRFTLLKWPALLALALMFCPPVDRPLLAATATDHNPPPTVETRTVEQGPVELKVTVDRREVRVADPFNLTIVARGPQGIAVQYPEMGDRFGEFLVTRTEDAFDVPDGDDRTWTRILRLESLTSGSKQLPPITLTYTDTRRQTNSEDTGTIATPPLPITIVSEVEATADPTHFRDIKGVVDLVEPKATSYVWAVWTAGGLGVSALAGLWMLAIRRRSLTAQQRAMQELDELEQSGLIETGDFDTFFCQATDILRRYIEQRFAIRAPRLSTPEFLEQLKAHTDFNDEQRGLLQAFLKLGDYVKFARYDVTATDAERALAHARRFVDQTPSNLADRPTPPVAANENHSLAVSA